MASEQQVLGRLNSLQETASRESIQTVAKYILLKRKQAKSICTTFLNELQNNCRNYGSKKVMLYISVLDEMLVADANHVSKWPRNSDFRNAIGDDILVSFLKSKGDWKYLVSLQVRGDNGSTTVMFREKMQLLCEKWRNQKCFSNDSILTELNILLDSMTEAMKQHETSVNDEENVPTPTEINPPNSETVKPELNSSEETKEPQNETKISEDALDVNEQKNPPKPSNDTKNDASTEKNNTPATNPSDENAQDTMKNINDTKYNEDHVNTTSEFEFPKVDKPLIKVEASDFLEPCKSIATMQIAREIRNDAAARLWSTLQNIPKEVDNFAKSIQDRDKIEDTEESDSVDAFFVENKYPLSDDVLDIDISEALSEVQQFRDVVLRQRKARKRCIDLLIDSQCQFGSMDAAQAFEDFGNMLKYVKKRKLLLSDAMELEGLDFVEESGDGGDMTGNGAGGSGDKDEDDLESFSWLKSKNTV